MASARFRGKFLYTIDDKGRINIPSRFRKILNPEANDTFVITLGTEGCLFVYPMDTWLQFEARLETLQPTPENNRFRRFLLDSSSDSALDRQGRIVLTQEQITFANLGRDLVIVGDIDKIRIWNPERYNQEFKTELEGKSFDQYYYEAMASLNSMHAEKGN